MSGQNYIKSILHTINKNIINIDRDSQGRVLYVGIAPRTETDDSTLWSIYKFNRTEEYVSSVKIAFGSWLSRTTLDYR